MKGKVYTEARTQGDVLNVVKNSTNIKQTSDKLELTATAVYSQRDLKVRYIRDWLNGSSGNTSNHWVQITAVKNDVNLALGKTVTGSSVANTSWPYTNITDGNFSTGKYGQSNVVGLQWVQVDLGSVITDIEYIQVFHYYGDGRTYNATKTEVSADGVTWYPIYDSLIGGTYPETADGRRYYVNDGSFLNRAESKITQTSNKISLVVSDTTNTIKGDALISAINVQPGSVQIDAKNVNITGAVTFNSFDNEAKAMLASGESQVLNRNHNFYDWPSGSAYPTGYTAQAGSAPTRVISDNNTGYSAQSVVPASVNTYYAQTITNQGYTEYATIQLTFKLVSGTIGGAGALFRLNNTTGGILQDHPVKIEDTVPSPVLNKWYTITKIVKSTTGTNFGSYVLFAMPAWSSLGAITAKTIQFDSVKVRPSTASEIQAYKAGSTVDTWTIDTTLIDGGKIKTNTIDVNALKAGTIDATKINVTNINASNITSGSFNASLITTGSLNADRITANTITANKLNIGAANLVNDPMLEAIGTTPFDATTAMTNNGWSKGSSVPTFVDDSTYGRVMKLTNVGAGNSTIFTNSFYVDSTKAYKITLRFKYSKSDGTTPTGSMYFGFNGYNSITSPSNEIANTGSYEYLSDGYSTSGTNPYFFITGKGQSGANAWQTVEVFLYPPEYYGDRMKLKNPTFPGYGTSKKVWFMGYKTNVMKLRLLNYNQSTSYGDGTSTNDLYVSSIQVTEVDAGTLTATNIVAGTLNADLISIASATSGVTINSGGVTANNSSTGVSVKMNSSTGFEIKKGADTVFTVNSDGSLTAKDLTVSATYASSNANTSYGFTALQKDGLVIQESNVNSVTGYSLSYTTKYGNRGMDMLMDQPGIGQQRMLLTTSGMRFSGYGGYNVDGVLIGIDSQGPRIETTDALGVITLNSSNKISMSGSSGISMNTATNSGSYKIDFRTNIMSVDTVFGKVNMTSSPSVSSVREVTIDLDPADQTAAYEGLRMFSRKNGVGLYEKGGSYTFLKHTPSINSSKKLTELFGEDITIYSNYDYTLKSNGNGLIQSNNNLNFDVKNLLDIGVRNANNGLTSVLFADGTKDSGGVWVELGGGARTHVYAGEKVIVPNTDLGFGNTSESIVIEANSNFYAYWGTQSGFVDNQGVVGIGGSFRPAVSGKLTLGNDTYRWSTIYAVNSLNTSDSSTKTNIIQLNDTKVHNPRFSYSRWEEKDEISPEIIYQEMKQMPLFLFEYKDIEGSSPQVGFMADQLLQDDKTGVASRFVNKETEDSIASASTQSYAATLHVALQEEMKRNDALEKKVEDLEARLLRLEQLLGGQS